MSTPRKFSGWFGHFILVDGLVSKLESVWQGEYVYEMDRWWCGLAWCVVNEWFQCVGIRSSWPNDALLWLFQLNWPSNLCICLSFSSFSRGAVQLCGYAACWRCHHWCWPDLNAVMSQLVMLAVDVIEGGWTCIEWPFLAKALWNWMVSLLFQMLVPLQ